MALNGREIEEPAGDDDLIAAMGIYQALCMSRFKGKGPGGDPEEIAMVFVST